MMLNFRSAEMRAGLPKPLAMCLTETCMSGDVARDHAAVCAVAAENGYVLNHDARKHFQK